MKVLSDEGQKMVPFSQRRHRLNPSELEPVMYAVESKLRQMIESQQDLMQARLLFRVYFRLREYVTSRPVYPPCETWKEISDYVNNGTVPVKEGAKCLRSAISID